MIKKIIAVSVLLPLTLTACSMFFDKDNTPTPTELTSFRPEVAPKLLWSANVGKGALSGDYLKMTPAVSQSAIYTTSSRGTITSINKINGRKNWQVAFGMPISAAPAAKNGIVIVGFRNGIIMALCETNGRQLWRASIPGEVIATPAIGEGYVIVKSIDGHVRAFSIVNGHEIWTYEQQEPNLILRGASAPVIAHQDVIVGYANGNLTKLDLNDGQLLWQQTVANPEGAFAIQRMIDIDADPIVFDYRIYVATYQGRISSLDWSTGRILWDHDISSYTGMAADYSAIYLTDATGYVWAFGADSGIVHWQQFKLRYRILSAPALQGDYVVVGDGEGYLHWLNKTNGHFAARVSLGSAIYATPVVENNILYALTKSGYLAAYALR